MRCALVYNPASGRNRSDRDAVINRIADALRSQRHKVDVQISPAPGAMTAIVRNIAADLDVVFACGGDGTVHEVLQALVREQPEKVAALGIVPLGTGNALARHLRLPLDPLKAALLLANGKTCTVPVGRVSRANSDRYFIVMAGCGPDGALVHNLLSSHKSRIGRLAYYIHAARMFVAHRFPVFEVEWASSPDGRVQRRRAVSVMAVRIRNLGGVFSGLAHPQAIIHGQSLCVSIVGPPAWLTLPLWFLSGWLRATRFNPFVQYVESTRFRCLSLGNSPVFAQVDGEFLGTLPFEVSFMPDALRLLTP